MAQAMGVFQSPSKYQLAPCSLKVGDSEMRAVSS
jgi:hypothetical protein